MQFAHRYEFLVYSDKIASVIVGIFIIKVGFDIVKENISMTIGEQITDQAYIKNIKDIIFKDEDVMEVKDLVVLKYGPYLKLNSEVSMAKNLSLIEAHNKIDDIETELKSMIVKLVILLFICVPILKKRISN